MRLAAPLLLAAILVAGCSSAPSDGGSSSTSGTHAMMASMGPGTYRMQLSGVPSAPMAPGQTFNVTVTAQMGPGMSMMSRSSDHIGAHFWNRTVSDPNASLGNATSCSHRAGDLPGSYEAACTAPTAAGVYHIRAHSRITENATKYNWWSDEQTFTVA
jgi:hypothetical protein